MFRRAVFALMLIGAAFAGGAAINGPAWPGSSATLPEVPRSSSITRPPKSLRQPCPQTISHRQHLLTR